MVEGAGGVDAGAEIGVSYYQPLSPELLFTAFPDYLLLTEGSIESAGGLEVVLELQGIADTPAAESGNVIVMDTQYLLGMSLRTGQALLDLAAAIHPEMTWERQVPLPYTLTDASGEAVTVATDGPLVALNPALLERSQQLGFHSLPAQALTPDALVLAAESDAWQALREAGQTVLVVPDDADIEAVAAALGVPGRGVALRAYLGQ
ncbi:MAG: ABC transporter substrate-binding protein [Anaerolineae bacterium]|nr:ABC transporter substrate-binding protein [Anaerolineae bacterium]